MLEKEFEEWKNLVDESVVFYTDKINQLNQILRDEKLDPVERQIIESELKNAIDEKKRWEQTQNELKT